MFCGSYLALMCFSRWYCPAENAWRVFCRCLIAIQEVHVDAICQMGGHGGFELASMRFDSRSPLGRWCECDDIQDQGARAQPEGVFTTIYPAHRAAHVAHLGDRQRGGSAQRCGELDDGLDGFVVELVQPGTAVREWNRVLRFLADGGAPP